MSAAGAIANEGKDSQHYFQLLVLIQELKVIS